MKFAVSGRLWHHTDFMRLWVGETVEWFGGQITYLALPTIAIFALKAGAFDIGVLNGLGYLAFPILGIFVGVMGDRWPRRPMMVLANIVQVVALGTIPIAFLLQKLSLYHLFAVAAVMGVSTVFFEVAYQSYLPTLVDRENLVEGNSKLTTSESTSQIAGPALAGFLIQLTGAAMAIAADALTTLFAALAIFSIKKPENAYGSKAERNFAREVREGAEVIFHNPLLRSLAATTATLNLGSSIFSAVFFLFMYNELRLSPGLAGVVLGIGSVGSLIGAVNAPKIGQKLGLGPTLAIALSLVGFGLLAIPLAMYGPSVPVLAALWMLSGVGITIYNITQISLRQAIVPDRLQGRMNATMRAIVWGALPVGAFIGGILGTEFGITQTIIIGGLISLLPVLLIMISPIGSLHKIPSNLETTKVANQSTAPRTFSH
ncbi:MAG: MFS transporter [Candidatus Bathyarchaeia archaeon]